MKIAERLHKAYEFFYPDKGEGFVPDVVDFFSVLSAYNQIDKGGLPDGFKDRALLVDLQFAIVHIICNNLKAISDEPITFGHSLLDEMILPGKIIVTTNWDTLPEMIAESKKVPYRLSIKNEHSGFGRTELTILKLHGSIDWLKHEDAKKGFGDEVYLKLGQLCASKRTVIPKIESPPEIIRTKIESKNRLWQTIKGATKRPYIITMAPGKADTLDPILGLWRSAYRAISSAKKLTIIGYSMPESDVEIRTLIRAGILRGNKKPNIGIVNPAPDVHARFRELIEGEMVSNYHPIERMG